MGVLLSPRGHSFKKCFEGRKFKNKMEKFPRLDKSEDKDCDVGIALTLFSSFTKGKVKTWVLSSNIGNVTNWKWKFYLILTLAL